MRISEVNFDVYNISILYFENKTKSVPINFYYNYLCALTTPKCLRIHVLKIIKKYIIHVIVHVLMTVFEHLFSIGL